MNFKSYFNHFPVTTGILIINGIIFGLNHLGLPQEYSISFPQIITMGTFLAHFSHIGIFHFAMNMVVAYRLCPMLETQIRSNAFLTVFLGIWFGLVAFLIPFQTTPILGFSGIMMGFITFLMLLSRNMNRAFSQSLMGLIGINILVGFLPQVSFLGHFGGVLIGGAVYGIYALLNRN